MTQIRIHYIDPNAYSLKEGECILFQEMTVDWDLPFLPRVGESLDLSCFIDLGTEQGQAYLFSDYQRLERNEEDGDTLFHDSREVLSVTWAKVGDRMMPTLLLGDYPLHFLETDSALHGPENELPT